MNHHMLKKVDVFQESGVLPELADRATAAGYRYFMLNGKIFELEAGRAEGSSLGVHALKGARLDVD